jgi:transcriptional regulator with XRE-family HTH domain
MSREQLAEAAGIPPGLVSALEEGRRWASDKTLSQLAKTLNMEVWTLFSPASGPHTSGPH